MNVPIKVDADREVVRRVAEHEVFLSFNCDVYAQAFLSWFFSEGLVRFREWLDCRKDEYSG